MTGAVPASGPPANRLVHLTVQLDFGAALRRARAADPAAVPEILASVAAEFGATDLVVYLVDFSQTTLEPLPDRATHADVPTAETVQATMAGRAFIDQRVVTAERDGVVRVWAPVLEGSDRTGVVALTVPSGDAAVLGACEDLGLLAGYLIAAHPNLGLSNHAQLSLVTEHVNAFGLVALRANGVPVESASGAVPASEITTAA